VVLICCQYKRTTAARKTAFKVTDQENELKQLRKRDNHTSIPFTRGDHALGLKYVHLSLPSLQISIKRTIRISKPKVLIIELLNTISLCSAMAAKIEDKAVRENFGISFDAVDCVTGVEIMRSIDSTIEGPSGAIKKIAYVLYTSRF
jgi:hypothetical protein